MKIDLKINYSICKKCSKYFKDKLFFVNFIKTIKQLTIKFRQKLIGYSNYK